jgi:hypothetical protein
MIPAISILVKSSSLIPLLGPQLAGSQEGLATIHPVSRPWNLEALLYAASCPDM